MSYLTGVRNQVQAWDRKAPKPSKEQPDLLARRVTSNYGGTEAAQSVDGSYESYANAYRSYVWVRKAIDEKAKNIQSLPVRVVDVDGKALDNHVISQLLRRGNDQLTMSQIWAQWLTSMELGGEGPLEIIDDLRGNPLWLWPRRPDYVLVQASIDPERANYPTVAGYVVMPEQVGGKPIDVPPGNMIFTRYHNPLSVWRGLAPIAAVRASIVIDVYAQAWSKTFFQKGARPDFGIIAPQGITATEKDRIKAEIMHQHSGNWFEPIVLEEGVTDIKPFSFPPSDMEWVQQRELTRNEIGAIFGVPDEVMGFGRDTYENYGKAVEAFWTLTLRPLVQFRDETLTHFFTARRPLLAPGERIETDLSGIGVLQEDLLPKVEAASKLWLMGAPFNQIDEQLRLGIGPVPNGEFPNGKDPAGDGQNSKDILGYHIESGVVTRNEARADVGLPPVDDSQDTLQRQLRAQLELMIAARNAGIDPQNAAQLVGLDVEIKPPPEPPAQGNSDGGSQDQQGSNQNQQQQGQEAQQGGKTAHPFSVRHGSLTPDKIARVKALVLQLDPGDPEAEQAIRMALERRTARELGRAISDMLETLYPDGWGGDWTRAEQEAIRVHNAFVRDQRLRDALSRALLDGVDLGISVGVGQLENVGFGFDWTLAHIPARDWAIAYTDQVLEQLAQVTARGVGQSIGRWLENGEPLESLIRDLEPYFGTDRAARIAATEVTRAVAEGSEAAYRESGVVSEVEFYSVRDERVCPLCGALHGKTTKLGERFDGGTYPPIHPNCRCFLRPVLAEPRR